MCGIAGILHPDRTQAESGVRAMSHALLHRGPDDEGMETMCVPGGFLVLGQRRLSIQDLSSAGHQPMQNPATKDRIVFNGEIYNYPDLRRELQTFGVSFRSHCDTEVILHAFTRWGLECFKRLHGMFAIGLYDRAQQRLILARDPIGIKPLYFAAIKDGFVFGSELRSIEASGLLGLEINRRALAGLLAYGAVPGPLTLRKGIALLEPGTWCQLQLPVSGKIQQSTRFWSFPSSMPDGPVRNVAVQEVRARLVAAARSHLLSDVPVGIFLSSGLDSTLLAALCAEVSPESFNSFTINMAGHPEMDESEVASATARELHTQHHNVSLDEGELLDQFKRWLSCVDQPSGDGLNTYIISAAVRAHGIKVAISGLGGDEIFGGYNTFQQVPKLASWAPVGHVFPNRIRSSLAGMLFKGKSKAQYQKALEMASTPPLLRNLYFRRRRLLSDLEMKGLGMERKELDLNDDFIPAESEPDRGLEAQDAHGAVGVLESRYYMGNTLLRDADVFGMAHGLEIRVPFLDQDLVDYIFTLPGRWRVAKNSVNKPLLQDALKDKIPSRVCGLRKRGFCLPQGAWMAGPLRQEFEQYLDVVRSSGWVNPDGVSAVWKDFLVDQTGPTWSRAWLLGVLGAWIMRESKKNRAKT